jgi:hypothetical protein
MARREYHPQSSRRAHMGIMRSRYFASECHDKDLQGIVRIRGLSPSHEPGLCPVQTHIRSPRSAAAPLSRVRRAWTQEDETLLLLGFSSQTLPRSVHLDPPSRSGPEDGKKNLVRAEGSGFQHGPFDDDPGGHILPERDQELACERGDHRLADASAMTLDTLMEPAAER